jgi:hypothetical protein
MMTMSVRMTDKHYKPGGAEQITQVRNGITWWKALPPHLMDDSGSVRALGLLLTFRQGGQIQCEFFVQSNLHPRDMLLETVDGNNFSRWGAARRA